MVEDTIELLIQGCYPDPDSDGFIGVPIRSIVIENSLAGHEADLVKETGLSGRLAVVSDPKTRAAMGDRVARALSAAGTVIPVELGDHPHPDGETVSALETQTMGCDALVAVGSGTINDLCKFVAARADKPYAVFATAPSMNGYTSANAAITVDGHKKSFPASTPAGVFIDLSVFSSAPARLIRSGLGDSCCRSTAQIDWLLSHHLFGTPYRLAPFALLAQDEPGLLGEPDALMRGDLAAMRRLARTLVLSGLGMTICGGSYPASQGEHLISHYIDMMAPSDRPEVFHGEQIAVTTLTMARLQESFLSSEAPPRLRPAKTRRQDLIEHFGHEVGHACWLELRQKILMPDEIDGLNARLSEAWNTFVTDCESIAVSSHRLEAALSAAEAPTGPESIGVDNDFYAAAVQHARELRNRYTFLDLAADAGELDPRISIQR